MWCCLYGNCSVHCFCLLAQQLSVSPVCAACYCEQEAQQDWEKHMDVHTLQFEKSCNILLNDHFGFKLFLSTLNILMKSDGKFRISTACGSLDHQMFLVETRGTVGHGRGNEVSAQYVQRFGTHLKDVEPCMQIPLNEWLSCCFRILTKKIRHFQMLTEQVKPCFRRIATTPTYSYI